MLRYEQFRRKNAYLYDCNIFGLQKVKYVYGGTLPDSPVNGRITLMRFGKLLKKLDRSDSVSGSQLGTTYVGEKHVIIQKMISFPKQSSIISKPVQ